MKSLKLLLIGSVAQAGLICEHPKLTKIQNEIKEIFQIYNFNVLKFFLNFEAIRNYQHADITIYNLYNIS